MICSGCGFNNQTAAKFCGGCGNQLQLATETDSRAERRILSVIFCDMVGATTLSEKIDPEDFRELLRAYHATCYEIVRAHDGFLADLMGDGVVIYFGYPTAHEDDEIRTVRCALALLDALHALGSGGSHPFAVRIGAHRGLVVVGSLGGASGLHSLAVGETPNVAARLQAEAKPGEVVVSDSLWRLISRYFQGISLGSRRLKGIERPVEIHRIISYQPASRYKGSADSFIGRKEELRKVSDQWSNMLSGQSQTLIIRGEPGIGKTRFIEQIKTRLADINTTVMQAFCSPISIDTPYFPIAEMLRNRLAFNDIDSIDQLKHLRSRLPELGLPEQEALPLLALFLSLQIDPRDWPILEELSLPRQRQRTLDLLVLGLRALAKQSPVLLIVEDLHWADASTIELLDQLLRNQFSGRLFIILSARLEFQSEWCALEQVTEIQLDALEGPDAETLICAVAANKPMPLDLVRQICLRSSGNPLFLEEITLSVISSTSVVEHDQTWKLVQQFSDDLVPASMEAALMSRLDQLGSAKQLLQMGATIGREFGLNLLAAICDKNPDELAAAMQQMVTTGFLQASDKSPLAYQFKHSLVQDVAYQSLLRSTRQRNHARIANVMATSFPDLAKQRPELLAHHLSGAGCHGESAQLWLLAGQDATERFAVHEAVKHLKHGLADIEQLSPNDHRWDLELSLLTALAPAQMATLGWASPIVNSTCQRASELAERLGENSRRFAPLWGLWSNQFVAGKLDDALQTSNQLLLLSQSSQQQMHAIAARNALSYTHFYRGEYYIAIQHADEGIKLFDDTLERQLCFILQSSPTVHILSAKSNSLWMLGEHGKANAGMKQMLELARSLAHPPTLATALAYMCLFYYYDHDWDLLFNVAHEAMELSSAEGFSLWYACAGMYKAIACLAREGGDGYYSEVLAFAELFRQTGTMVSDPSTSTLLITAYQHAGRLHDALEESMRSLKTANEGQIKVMVPEVLRCQADIFKTLGRHQDADNAFRLAVVSASKQSARLLQLRALVARLSHCIEQNIGESVATELRDLLSTFPVDSSSPDVRQAQALLAKGWS